jgi:hypothetical protein
MADLLARAHERGFEADLAAPLDADLTSDRLSDIKALSERFPPDPAALPEVVVRLASLSDYGELLGGETGDAS